MKHQHFQWIPWKTHTFFWVFQQQNTHTQKKKTLFNRPPGCGKFPAQSSPNRWVFPGSSSYSTPQAKSWRAIRTVPSRSWVDGWPGTSYKKIPLAVPKETVPKKCLWTTSYLGIHRENSRKLYNPVWCVLFGETLSLKSYSFSDWNPKNPILARGLDC